MYSSTDLKSVLATTATVPTARARFWYRECSHLARSACSGAILVLGVLTSRPFNRSCVSVGRSVHRQVIGGVGQPGDAAPLPTQHEAPQILRIFMEHIVAKCVEDHPRPGRDLGVELSAGPAGVPTKQPNPAH